MKNKKILLLISLIVSLAGLIIINQSRKDNDEKSNISLGPNESILKKDRLALEQNISPKTLQDENWSDINDYSIAPKDLVNKNNAKNFFKISKTTIAELASCLKKDFCGMKKRNDKDAYFDATKTPGHILLGRNLSIMFFALKANPRMKNEVDWDLIEELTDNENELIQLMAVKLIKEFNDRDTESLLKIVDRYKGAAKADALSEIKTLDPSNERSLLLNSLEKSFSIDDPHTVISIIEKLHKMHLGESQLMKISQSLCHYKENGTDDPNWKMIKYNMSKSKVDLDIICPN